MAVQTGQMCNADALLAEEGAREKIFNGLGTHLKKKKKKGGGKKEKKNPSLVFLLNLPVQRTLF